MFLGKLHLPANGLRHEGGVEEAEVPGSVGRHEPVVVLALYGLCVQGMGRCLVDPADSIILICYFRYKFRGGMDVRFANYSRC